MVNSRIIVPNLPLRRLLTTSSTEDAIVDLGQQLAAFEPVDESGDPSANYGVINTEGAAVLGLCVFGEDDANETIDTRLSMVKRVNGDHYLPIPFLTATWTLGTASGVAGSSLADASDHWADTVVVNGGIQGYDLYSPADNTVAHLLVNLNGCGEVIIQTDLNGSATNANVAYWLS